MTAPRSDGRRAPSVRLLGAIMSVALSAAVADAGASDGRAPFTTRPHPHTSRATRPHGLRSRGADQALPNTAPPSPTFGAAGPPPIGAAGPPPLGAAGPPPLGAPGSPPTAGVGVRAPIIDGAPLDGAATGDDGRSPSDILPSD